ncbi:histidine kinase [Dyadobacter sp. CY345]|uniref:sensor histidine kinase n=1 Tax=Dyadobacter sp. CY345 TaxID=2909335 RepID=UPI001F458165|nr:histidine kinase [Dyadobacter sp. CY345]MCF2446783.1 histidine kinase [Dyadobacter sp. CY345]
MGNSADHAMMTRDWVFRGFVSDQYRIFRHFTLIFLIVLVMFNSQPQFVEPIMTIVRISLILMFVLLFYTNMYWLVPRFLFKDQYLTYVLSVLVIIAVIAFIYFSSWKILGAYRRADAYKEAAGIFSLSFIVLVLMMSSTAIKLFQRSLKDSIRINELEKTTMRSELEQLKNQINPHFLFNMLNNANVLTQKDPLKASQVLMKLSDLLRYQLYDSARTSVLLTGDIHFLEDFLNLEQIRRDNFDYLVSKQGDLSGVQIAPLLLIPFVENAIKHNADQEKRSYVHLYFDVHNGELSFKCVNSKPHVKLTKNEVGGLGLANVKRRLELIYPGKHALQIIDNPDTYLVILTLSI